MDDDREERRQAVRHRVLKGGKIVFNAGRSVIDCQVRNVTEAGARIKVAAVVGVPAEFELRITGETPRQCRVVWHKGQEIGVAFA